LVNNAGLMPFVSLREGTPEDVQKIIDVNFTSHFWVSLKLIFNQN
jgi:NAD(P)-dependent dehydrogenase (short-subunit alcohol dehydrogenase family)